MFSGVNGVTLPRCCGHRRSSSLPVPPPVLGTKSSNGKENVNQHSGKEQDGMWKCLEKYLVQYRSHQSRLVRCEF